VTQSTPIPIAGLAHVGIRVHPGITHIALLCSDIRAANARLEAAGFPLSGGPVRYSPTAQGTFVRDPDGNVIELHQRG
jgi:catechol 2,3-dioxygenase-like lactoylglutathione lyase family enzyme